MRNIFRRTSVHDEHHLEPWPKYYARRIAKYGGPEGYMQEKISSRGFLLESVERHTPKKGKILEAGCGSSMLSIAMSKKGFKVTALDNDPTMLEVAQPLNQHFETGVDYIIGDLFRMPFPDQSFDTIFSHGVLEHFTPQELVNAFNEALRVAKVAAFSFPTWFNWSPSLHGDENLWTYFKWKSIVEQSDGQLIDARGAFSRRPIREAINVYFDRRLHWVAPNLVVVIGKIENELPK